MQADAYAGFNQLYEAGRKPGPIIEAACWSHARRKFYELAQLKQAPIAIEAVKRIDALFAIEREINGASAEHRLAVRGERSQPLVAALQVYLREQRGRLSGKSETARAIDYSLKRWPALARFLDDGRLCLSNNAAERALRGIAIGRHNWTFAGSDEGGRRAAEIGEPGERWHPIALEPVPGGGRFAGQAHQPPERHQDQETDEGIGPRFLPILHVER